MTSGPRLATGSMAAAAAAPAVAGWGLPRGTCPCATRGMAAGCCCCTRLPRRPKGWTCVSPRSSAARGPPCRACCLAVAMPCRPVRKQLASRCARWLFCVCSVAGLQAPTSCPGCRPAAQPLGCRSPRCAMSWWHAQRGGCAWRELGRLPAVPPPPQTADLPGLLLLLEAAGGFPPGATQARAQLAAVRPAAYQRQRAALRCCSCRAASGPGWPAATGSVAARCCRHCCCQQASAAGCRPAAAPAHRVTAGAA